MKIKSIFIIDKNWKMNLDNKLSFFDDNNLICSVTKIKHLIDLDDPKILPCGFNACYKCIKEMRSFLTNTMDCCCCNNVHKIKSVSGLPSNKDNLIDLFRKSFIHQLNYLNEQSTQLSTNEGLLTKSRFRILSIKYFIFQYVKKPLKKPLIIWMKKSI
jgi:hypothetical protein